ncbi:MAG: cation:proton antiporter [Rheinheimera sp.]|nr:cation:proton antiporter [Rheinheimera sp.]
MDAVNFIVLLVGALFSVSIIATLISARFGAPLLLIFLVVGMLAGEDGPLGIGFSNPDVALLIGSIALVIILFDGGMRTHPDRVRVVLAPLGDARNGRCCGDLLIARSCCDVAFRFVVARRIIVRRYLKFY